MGKKGYRIIICCLLLIVTGVLYTSTKASSVDPGTIQDPLVTKSYVDEKIAQISNNQGSSSGNNQNTNTDIDYAKIYSEVSMYIDGKLEGIGDNTATAKFEIIELEAGQKLICKDSTEVILRAGSATIIGNETGDGISDITIGIDLAMGVVVPKNHLLIVPRDDGRGLQIATKAYVMVKGEYSVEDEVTSEEEVATDIGEDGN
ncbi:hypothetical protein [Vallitalea guaymasensis]|uniref:Uncharacterized protein n=1 Tax=Vallitalea guaymasensis TaxID=1185412 RepID=A0A8J8MBX2_9FIRM|nr:hypothetical protein [Vallitalea guaymasensis]QUH30136.1 hypothetical protein HYG85_14915 [Vallitalea guaymasensis]